MRNRATSKGGPDQWSPSPESQGPTTEAPETTTQVDHIYNNPSLGPIQFLRAVVHDPNTSLHHRMRAAELLMGLGVGHIGVEREPDITYRRCCKEPDGCV